MADLAAVQTAVSSLTAAVQALEAKVSGAAPTVLQSDLDPIVASLTSLTTSIEALVSSYRHDEPSFLPGDTGARRRLHRRAGCCCQS